MKMKKYVVAILAICSPLLLGSVHYVYAANVDDSFEKVLSENGTVIENIRFPINSVDYYAMYNSLQEQNKYMFSKMYENESITAEQLVELYFYSLDEDAQELFLKHTACEKIDVDASNGTILIDYNVEDE